MITKIETQKFFLPIPMLLNLEKLHGNLGRTATLLQWRRRFRLLSGSQGPRLHRETRVVPFPSGLVFDVVTSVPSYKEFLPYTVESFVKEEISRNEVEAVLTVGFMSFRESYTSRVVMDPADKTVKAVSADSRLFKELTTTWKISDRPLDPRSCSVEFELLFEFRSSIYNSAANLFFEHLTKSMLNAFIERCKVIEDEYEKEEDLKKARDAAAQAEARSTRFVLDELEALSHFDMRELERIKHDFDRSATNQKNLSPAAFDEMFLELFRNSGHPKTQLKKSARQIFDALDMNRDGSLTLREFTAGLSTMMKGSPEERCRFWFRCFDVNSDGLIDRKELFNMIRASVEVRNALLQVGATNKVNFNGSFPIEDASVLASEAVEKCLQAEGKDSISMRTLLEQKLF